MNYCYCVGRVIFNLSICRQDRHENKHNLPFIVYITDGNYSHSEKVNNSHITNENANDFLLVGVL